MISQAPAGADIFTASADVLVNPVNTKGKMGKGLALVFKQRFPEMDREYREVCQFGALEPGGIFVWKNPTGSPTFIVNLATKDSPWEPSRYEWVESGLKSLRDWSERNEIDSIACPALGAGLGGLEEARVHEIASRVFSSSNVTLLWHGKLENFKGAAKVDPEPGVPSSPQERSALSPERFAQVVARSRMRQTPTHVYFWGGPLSQWFPSPFSATLLNESDSREFNCAEQFMMASKAQMFGDTEAFERIMKSTMPQDQKKIGRTVRGFEPERWDVSVPEILVRANVAKFSQDANLRSFLLATVQKRLVEGSPYDTIYGVGLQYDDPKIENEANWRGKNLLGQLLEVTRESIRSRERGDVSLPPEGVIRRSERARTAAAEIEGRRMDVRAETFQSEKISLRIANASDLRKDKTQASGIASRESMGYVGRSKWVPDDLGITWYPALRNQNKIESFGGKREPAILAFEADLVDALKDQRSDAKAMQAALAEIVDVAEEKKTFTFVCHCSPSACHCNVILTYVGLTLKNRGHELDVLDIDRQRAVEFKDLRAFFRQASVEQTVGRQ
jgi:ribA/ribD-fused uncharacterized protein